MYSSVLDLRASHNPAQLNTSSSNPDQTISKRIANRLLNTGGTQLTRTGNGLSLLYYVRAERANDEVEHVLHLLYKSPKEST